MSAPEHDQAIEDAQFDSYMQRHFGVDPLGAPATPGPSHIAGEAGTYPAPPEPAAEPEPDADPDTHAGPRQTESDDVLEEKVIDAYMRQHFPGTTP